jgi:hypothetical protein
LSGARVNKLVWASIIAVVCISLAAVAGAWWVYNENSFLPKQDKGFVLALNDGSLTLLSDADIISFNLTSQEIAITDNASERLTNFGNGLYNFSSVYVFRVNSEEVYQGIFRSAIMSAVPSPPKIAVLYPSFDYLTNEENNHAIRLFYPNFEVPGYQTENNAKLVAYFQEAGKVVS